MRIVMISTDRNIFNPKSAVAGRMIDYGKLLGELHIVVFSLDIQGFGPMRISPNVYVYPTSSQSKISYITDGVKVGAGIIKEIYFGETAITSQDPFETAAVGIALKKRFKIPLQIQLHTDLYSKEFFDGSFMNWFRFQMSRFTLPHADGIRVVRETIKQGIVENIKYDPKKIVVLPVFVDIKKIIDYPITVNLKIKYKQWSEVVFMASRLTPEKNVPMAIRAFKKLVAQNPKIGLVIVGQGPLELRLKVLVSKLGITENVVFEPWQQDLSSYYKTASLFLNTSNFEGYGMTLVEAGAAGAPVLTTNIGIAQDFFVDGKNALVCPVRDEQCIANKMITFFSNSLIQNNLREEIAKDIQRLIMSYDEHLKKQKESFDMLFQEQKK